MTDYQAALDAFRAGDNDTARRLSEQALANARAESDDPAEVDALCMLARVALREGDFARVRERADEAHAKAVSTGSERVERMPVHMQAVAARMSGDADQARELYEKSIELNQRLGEVRMVAAELHNLAYVELHAGRTARALELFTEARLQARRIGYGALNPCLVGDLAVMAAFRGDLEGAARLAGASAAAFEAAGVVADPDDEAEQRSLRERLARDLGDAFGSLYAAGARLEAEDVLDQAGD